MIVKVTVFETGVVISNQSGQKLFASKEEKDIELAENVMAHPGQHVRYFNAHWNKGIVALVKPTTGYTF